MTKRETIRQYLPLNVIQQEANNTYEVFLGEKRFNLDSPVDLTTNLQEKGHHRYTIFKIQNVGYSIKQKMIKSSNVMWRFCVGSDLSKTCKIKFMR